MNQPNPSPRPSGFFRGALWLLTAPHRSLKEFTAQRDARLSAGIAIIVFGLALVGFTATLFSSDISYALASFSPILGAALLGYLLSRTRFYRIGVFLVSIGFSATPYIISLLQFTTPERSYYLSLLLTPIAIVIASGILSASSIFLLVGINEAMLFGVHVFLFKRDDPYIGSLAGMITVLGLMVMYLNYHKQSTEKQRLHDLQTTNRELQAIKENLEENVEERTAELNRRSSQLEAASIVSRTAAEERELETLLNSVVRQITQSFGHYHAGIFLTDAGSQYVILQATSSQGGQKMLARGHKLPVARQGIVGYAAYQKRPRVAQNVNDESAFLNNPDLPETRSELALPLLVRERLLGVLDTQSTQRNAFSLDDIATLQTMADQIALAIENARLIEESRNSLEQLQKITIESTAKVWQERIGKQVHGYRYTPIKLEALPHSFSAPQESPRLVKIPVKLRGQVIGSISMQRKSAEVAWSGAEKEMIERIASQVALAIENARLLEESQRRAIKEQTVNEFSNRFSRSLDVDALLQSAVRELHRLPKVSEVSVYIDPSSKTETP